MGYRRCTDLKRYLGAGHCFSYRECHHYNLSLPRSGPPKVSHGALASLGASGSHHIGERRTSGWCYRLLLLPGSYSSSHHGADCSIVSRADGGTADDDRLRIPSDHVARLFTVYLVPRLLRHKTPPHTRLLVVGDEYLPRFQRLRLGAPLFLPDRQAPSVR